MLALAVETATDLAGVALAADGIVLDSITDTRGRRHGETVAPAVAEVCRRSGRTLAEVELLVADVGPGLFTGLRVGLATVKALGLALGCPAVGVGSLEVLAVGAARRMHGDGDVVAVVDARRGQLFAGRFAVQAGSVSPLAEARLCDPDELFAELTSAGPALCVGDGSQRYRELLSAVPGVEVADDVVHPDPGDLALIGLTRAHAAVPATALVADYRREADVRINWEQRLVPRPSAPAEKS